MVIFLNADGSCQKVTPRHVYQGSNNVNDITVVAPYPSTTAMQIGFILPDGLYWESSDGGRYAPMELMQQSIAPNVNAWHYNLKASVTQQMGELYVAFNAVTLGGNTTSYLCKVFIEESVLPNLPTTPEPGVYDLLHLYINMLDARTQNVPNLVASIQKVEGVDNAFTYTNNSGLVSEPIVIGEGTKTPTLSNNASKVTIPNTAWVAQYVGTEIFEYTCDVTAGLHEQMRDGATAADLWVSFDETNGATLNGAFKRYTIDTAGNITVYVNRPVTLTVRVWNGKGGYDGDARAQIAAETERAETEEQKLQTQITELQNTGVDEVARADIAEETERAKSAEEELQTALQAETTRAKNAETDLQEQITDIKDNAVAFNATGWNATPSGMAYLGVFYLALTVPTGKRIVQVLDGNNMPRGVWRGNNVYANAPFAGRAIII